MFLSTVQAAPSEAGSFSLASPRTQRQKWQTALAKLEYHFAFTAPRYTPLDKEPTGPIMVGALAWPIPSGKGLLGPRHAHKELTLERLLLTQNS